jgi:uncharacterized protein
MSGTKQDYINYRVSKSNELFEDVKLLASNQRWNSCVNRLYYSCFYLVSALLYKNDFNSDTHNGTKTQFNLHFIKTGKLETKYGKLYSNLFIWRQESDYSDFVDFDGETVIPLIEQVSELNFLLSEMIKE